MCAVRLANPKSITISDFAPGSDLHELKTFLSARLLWNISRVPNDEIAFFLKTYYGEGAASVKLYMDTMVGSMASEGFCRADGGQSITFPPTVPFLSPMAVLTSIQGFKEGEAATASVPKHHFRVQRAAMSSRFVALLRWDEFRHFAATHAIPWPLESSKHEAYAQWELLVNRTMQSPLGRNGALTGYSHWPLSYYR